MIGRGETSGEDRLPLLDTDVTSGISVVLEHWCVRVVDIPVLLIVSPQVL
jgi:hypothetical protein